MTDEARETTVVHHDQNSDVTPGLWRRTSLSDFSTAAGIPVLANGGRLAWAYRGDRAP